MKKYMIADMVKGIREDLIQTAMDRYNINESEAIRFVDNFPNESTWADVEETAEALGIDITDVEDDDVENFMSMGGTGKGELESSIGPIQWIYDNKLKAFIVYIALSDMTCGTGEVLYKLDKDQMMNWKNSDSMGEYYNDNVRSNIDEDPNVSCGCCDNLCDPQDIADFQEKYSSIS
jgi:hypothetical protein